MSKKYILTPVERLKIYESALTSMIHSDVRNKQGLCFFINEGLHNQYNDISDELWFKYNPYDNINEYPEVYKHRPHISQSQLAIKGYWWNFSEKNTEKRKHIIELAIEEVKGKIKFENDRRVTYMLKALYY